MAKPKKRERHFIQKRRRRRFELKFVKSAAMRGKELSGFEKKGRKKLLPLLPINDAI